MHISRKINTFSNQHPFVGPITWILCVQFFVVQYIVASAWKIPHSWNSNTISDLGNTTCGAYGDRFVCSPMHSLMNSSFGILGISMAIGSALIYYGFKRTTKSYIGFSLMAVAGVGTWFVGVFPEDTIGILHTFGAALPFLFGNLSLIILGLELDMPRLLKFYTLFSGTIALIALVLFLSENYLIFAIGGMERIVAYPQTIWMIVFGVYISANRIRTENILH
ncbi:MAG: DUF998 domain-containing protein [bacterium]|nr:DUF998 domain-containing protein [bacterium]